MMLPMEYDTAIVGIARSACMPDVVAYDEEKVIEILEKDMEYEEAVEFYEFNIACSYVGEGTPIFITRPC